VVEESLVCLGDPRTVFGGEEIQEQAADHGDAEAGVGFNTDDSSATATRKATTDHRQGGRS
jgi:hypothetical protein